MNHQKSAKKMPGKTTAHTHSVIKSQVIELIRNNQIKTTETKGKILKSRFDKLVTLAKRDTNASKMKIESFFGGDKKATVRLYEVVKEKLGDRNSGYTHVFHTLPRKGDRARQVYVILVNTEAKEKVSKTKKLLAKRKKEEGEKSVVGKIKKTAGKKAEKEVKK